MTEKELLQEDINKKTKLILINDIDDTNS